MRKPEKKYVLNFAEIVIVIFIAIVFLCVFWSKSFDVRQESNVIYGWKKMLGVAKYSYDVVLMAEGQTIEKIVKLPPDVRNVQILNLFAKHMDLVADKSLSRYKYRYLNGLRVSEEDEYFVDDFVYDNDKKVIIGINWINPNCFSDSNKCGIAIFDMNGKKGPNRFGLDVFGADIYNDTLLPFGSGLSYDRAAKNCAKLESGVFCSSFYLIGGQFFK